MPLAALIAESLNTVEGPAPAPAPAPSGGRLAVPTRRRVLRYDVRLGTPTSRSRASLRLDATTHATPATVAHAAYLPVAIRAAAEDDDGLTALMLAWLAWDEW